MTGYSITLARIAELSSEQDDVDAPIPTAYAREQAETLLGQTYDLIREAFPAAAVSSTDNGGIRVQWMRSSVDVRLVSIQTTNTFDKEVQWMRSSADVRLVIPGQETERAYIFFEVGNHYETEEVSPDNLARRLIWLNSTSQT